MRGGQSISFSQLRSTFVSALLPVSARRKCSPTHRVGTLESIAYGQSSHITHTGGTFGTRQLSWLVTKYSVFPAQAFTFCTAYYSVLSYSNFYVRVVTRACYTSSLLQTNKKASGKILVPPFWASLSKYLLDTLQISSKYSRTRPFCTSISGDAASTCNS